MKQITFNPNNEPYYSEDFIKGFKCGAERQFEADKADILQEKTISVDALREILSDVKEAHRNNSEAEAVIADVWDEVKDALKGADDDIH